MFTICFKTFLEEMPSVGRTIMVLSDKRGSFGHSTITDKRGKVTLEDFHDDVFGDRTVLCVDEVPVEHGGEIDINDYWVYEDELVPKLGNTLFYADWEYYARTGQATMRVCGKPEKVYHPKRGYQGMFAKYLYKKDGRTWVLSFNGSHMYQCEELT